MVSSSAPPPCPPSAEIGYSKIGSSSSSALQYSSDKLGCSGNKDSQQNKLRSFCAGYGGRAIACAVAALGICLLVVLLVQGHHRHKGEEDLYQPPPLGSPLSAPAPSSTFPASSPEETPQSSPPPAPANVSSLVSLCNTTEQPQLCITTLSAYPSNKATALLQDLTAFVAKAALTAVNQTDMLAVNLSQAGNGSHGEQAALQDCLELLDQSRDGLNDSINGLSQLDAHTDSKDVKGQVLNVRVSLSASYTDQDTCWEGFDDTEGTIKDQLLKSGQSIAPLISMALSLAQTLADVGLSSYYAVHPSAP